MGSIVSYAESVKQRVLNVEVGTLKKFSDVSVQTASEMSSGAAQQLQTKIVVAITGLAGPTGGTPEKPVGLVYIAVAAPRGTATLKHHFSGSHAKIRSAAVETALRHLLAAVAS